MQVNGITPIQFAGKGRRIATLVGGVALTATSLFGLGKATWPKVEYQMAKSGCEIDHKQSDCQKADETKKAADDGLLLAIPSAIGLATGFTMAELAWKARPRQDKKSKATQEKEETV